MAIDENTPRDWDAELAQLLDAEHKHTGHFDVALDDAPQSGGMPVDVPEIPVEGRRDVIPPVLRSWKAFKAEAYQTLGRWAHIAASPTRSSS